MTPTGRFERERFFFRRVGLCHLIKTWGYWIAKMIAIAMQSEIIAMSKV